MPKTRLLIIALILFFNIINTYSFPLETIPSKKELTKEVMEAKKLLKTGNLEKSLIKSRLIPFPATSSRYL